MSHASGQDGGIIAPGGQPAHEGRRYRLRAFLFESRKVVPMPLSRDTVGVQDEHPFVIPIQTSYLDAGLAHSQNAPLDREEEPRLPRPSARFHISEAGKFGLTRRQEPDQRYHSAARPAASAVGAFEDSL